MKYSISGLAQLALTQASNKLSMSSLAFALHPAENYVRTSGDFFMSLKSSSPQSIFSQTPWPCVEWIKLYWRNTMWVFLAWASTYIMIQNQPPPPRYLTKMCHKNHKQIKLLILIQIQALVLKLPDTLFATIKPVYALLQELIPPRFRHKFLRNNQFRTYNKRNSHALHFCRTNTKEFSVFFRGPKFYNSLDSETIKTNSIYIFKKTLNTQ